MEKFIRVSAIIATLIGLPLVFLLVNSLDAQPSGSAIELTGVVERVWQKNKVTILTIAPAPSVPVVVFDEMPFEQGNNITVYGRVKEYRGKIEIVAEEVRVD